MPETKSFSPIIGQPSTPTIRGKLIGTYLMEHPATGKYYVGSSSDLLKRKSSHLSALSRGAHICTALQAAYTADPTFKWTFWICGTREYAYELEQQLLDQIFEKGIQLNTAPKAIHPSLGLTRSQEWRDKISKRNKNNQYAKGMKYTDEQRAANSARQKGKKRDPALVEATAAKLRGRPQSAELIAKRRQVMLNKAFKRPVMVNGVQYDSTVHAADSLGIKRSTMLYRIQSDSPTWNDYKYLGERKPK